MKNTLALSELCKVLCLVKEINNIILPLGMVEKNELRTMDTPYSLLETLQRRIHRIVIRGVLAI